MFQGAITVQSTSTIMTVGWFGCVKLLPLVDRSDPPSKKKCFSNALGYTLVVLEVL